MDMILPPAAFFAAAVYQAYQGNVDVSCFCFIMSIIIGLMALCSKE